MPLSERIVVDPAVLAGKPVIRGTRLAVELILDILAAGQSENELLTNYPGLTREDILAALSRLFCLVDRPKGTTLWASFHLGHLSALDAPLTDRKTPIPASQNGTISAHKWNITRDFYSF